MEAAITPRTRLAIINSPNNPTGAVIPPAEFERIYEVCLRRGVLLMTDECYSHFTYGSAQPYSLASVRGSKPNIIVVGSLSKTFAMTGWRIGYTLAPKPLIDAMTKMQSQSTSNPTSIAQYAALAALTGPMDSVPVMLAEYARRRARILAGLSAIPGVTCAEPSGAFYAFPDVSARLVNGSGDSTAAGASNCSNASTWPWFPATRSARRDFCAFPTPLRSSASKKACGGWRHFFAAAAAAT